MGKGNQESEISISKIYHRGHPCIAIQSKYDIAIINRIKALPNRKYSKTRKLWYLPYNNESYKHIIESGISYTIINDAIETRQTVPSSDNIDIESKEGSKSNLSESENDSGNYSSDISSNSDELILPLIIYNSGYLIVDMKYDHDEILFIKSLKSTYWNEVEKKWICKATLNNLRALQHRYDCWSIEQYSKIEKLIILGAADKKAILRMSSDNGRMELRFSSKSEIPKWLKKESGRGYDSKRKVWSLPVSSAVKDRLLVQLKESGYNIEDYTSKRSDNIANSRDWSIKRKHVLSKVPIEYHPTVGSMLDVLIRERYSYSTIISYVGSLTRFLHYLKEHNITDITSEIVGGYLNKIANSNVSNASINLHQSALRLYFSKVSTNDYISFELLKRPRKHTSLPKVMTKTQVRLLLSNIKNLKHLSMLYLAYGAGLRSSEICKLRKQDIDWEKNQIWIRKGKGNKDRIVMMSVVIRNILHEYLKKYEPKSKWIFEGQKKGQAYSSTSLSKVFKRALAVARLPSSFVLHSLRHSFATHLMDTGTDVRLIKDLLGHKDIKTTLIYTHVSNDALRRITSPLDTLYLENLNKKL